MTGDMAPWQRLGEHLVARRVALGWNRRAAFARDKGLPNDRILFDVENAKRTNYDAATYAVLEQTYEWTTGSVRAVLGGGNPTPLPGPAGSVGASADDGGFVADRGPDDRSPGISDEELLDEIRQVRREVDERFDDLERRVRGRSVEGPQ